MHNSHSVFLHAASPSVYWTVCHLNRPRTGVWGSYVFTPARCYMRLRVHWADANGRLIRSARGRQSLEGGGLCWFRQHLRACVFWFSRYTGG
ncbi:hypothetical protein V8C44DRAFT_335413 [Trichoderma aethiopicum]